MKLLVSLLFCALIAGCVRPPECGEEKVIGLVKKITSDSLLQAEPSVTQWFDVDLRLVTKDGYDSDAAKWKCSGQIALKPKEGVLKMLNDYITLLQKFKNPSLDVVIARAFAETFGSRAVLSDRDAEMLLFGAARNWRPLTDADFVTSITFTSQLEEKTRDLVVGVKGVHSFNQYTTLARAASDTLTEIEARERKELAEKALKTQAAAAASAAAAAAAQESQTTAEVKVELASATVCGEEAICLKTTTGTTYRGNFFAMSNSLREGISELAKRNGSVCLKGVSPEKDFDSAERC